MGLHHTKVGFEKLIHVAPIHLTPRRSGVKNGSFYVAPVSTDPKDYDTGNVIVNNTVRQVGVEFRGSAGINVGFAADTLISNNEVGVVPNTVRTLSTP